MPCQTDFGGLWKQMPVYSVCFLIIMLASIGLPGTNGFVGEFLILLGTFQAYWLFGVFAVTGVIFGAAYFLWFYERAMFGPLSPNFPRTITDLNAREMIIAVSLCVMIFWIGLYPSPFLRMMNGSIQALESRLHRGTAANAPAPTVNRAAAEMNKKEPGRKI